MKVEFEGRTWEYDEDRVSVQQAIAFHFAYGFNILDWQLAIEKLDPRALQCCYWLMLQQAGVVGPLKDCDFAVVEFAAAYRAAQDAEAAEEPEPDPTSEPPSGPQAEPTASKASATRTATTQAHRGRRESPTGS